MEVNIYIESNNDNLSFDTNDYYKDNEYIEALEKEYNSTKDVIFNTINEGNLGVLSDSDSSVNSFTLFNKNYPKNEEKHYYTSSKGMICLDKSVDMVVDDLVGFMVTEKPFNFILKVDINDINEDFEYEFKMWFNENEKIKSVSNDSYLNRLPSKDIRIEFKNDLGEIRYGILKNCILLERYEFGEYLIKSERIIFIKDINE